MDIDTEARRQRFDVIACLAAKKSSTSLITDEVYDAIKSALENPAKKISSAIAKRINNHSYEIIIQPTLIIDSTDVLCVPSKEATPFGNYKVVVRLNQIFDAIRHIHDVEHVGIQKTFREVKSMFVGIPRGLVSAYVKDCATCAMQSHHARPSVESTMNANKRKVIPCSEDLSNFEKVPEKHDEELKQDDLFCTNKNLEQRIQYLNQELTIRGYESILSNKCTGNNNNNNNIMAGLDVAKLVNNTYELIRRQHSPEYTHTEYLEARNEAEMYKKSTSNFEEKEKAISHENACMREVLTDVQGELLSMDASAEDIEEDTKRLQMPFHIVKQDDGPISIQQFNEDLLSALQECKEVVNAQEKMLEKKNLQVDYYEEAFEKMLLNIDEVKIQTPSSIIEERKKLQEERKQFDDYVLQIAKEKEHFERERVDFYRHCISTPILNTEKKKKNQKDLRQDSALNNRTETPSTADLYKFLSLNYDSGISPATERLSSLDGSYMQPHSANKRLTPPSSQKLQKSHASNVEE